MCQACKKISAYRKPINTRFQGCRVCSCSENYYDNKHFDKAYQPSCKISTRIKASLASRLVGLAIRNKNQNVSQAVCVYHQGNYVMDNGSDLVYRPVFSQIHGLRYGMASIHL